MTRAQTVRGYVIVLGGLAVSIALALEWRDTFGGWKP